MDNAALLQTALDRFKLTAETEQAQRTREIEDLRFVEWDEQWPDDVKLTRQGQSGGGGIPPVPPRPCLTINKLRQPVQQITNQARSSRLMLQFAPKGDGADKKTAEVFEDIARAIQVDSRAHLARHWAFERAAKCGRGAYRIVTEYANDGDFDQDIVYKRILNQSSVYFDPFAQEPDWSDGEWCFLTEDVPLERFKRLYPDSEIAGLDDEDLTSVGDASPGWVGEDLRGGKVIRIAEYWYVEHRPLTIHRLADGSIVRGDEPLPEGAVVDASREVDDRRVMWCKITCCDILEGPQEWNGRYIPVIPVIGDESNINGERRWQGIVRPAMDAQRSYNYMRSAQVEGVGLAPRAPFVAYAETIDGFESWWLQANTRNFPYLPIKKATDATGAALPPPQRNAVEPAIQAITLAAHEATEDIHSTTGVPPVALGQLDPHDRSGKAISALQQQAELGSAAYLDNLANMSMQYEGKVLRDLIPRIYDRPGRIVAAIGQDEQRKLVMVGQPFTRDQAGQPVPASNPNEPGVEVYDLKRGEYTVAVKVGKSYTTRLEQQGEMLGNIAQAAPNLLPAFADIWVEDLDIPGGTRIADRIRKVTGQGDDDKQADPKVLMQQLQQAGQMLQMVTKELQAKNQIIEGDVVKQQADLEKARLDNATKLEIARINAQTSITEAEIKAGMADLANQIRILESMIGNAHAAAEQGREHAHALEQADRQAQQQREQQAMQQGHEQQMAAQQAAQTQEGGAS